jgi:hypothetical protein
MVNDQVQESNTGKTVLLVLFATPFETGFSRETGQFEKESDSIHTNHDVRGNK